MTRYLPKRESWAFWKRRGVTYRRKRQGWVVKSAEGHRFTNYGRGADR